MDKHDMTIGIEQLGEDSYVAIKAIGKLTHEDYQRIVPLLDAALAEMDEPQLKVLFDASEFQGWELRAAWDDFKLGISHRTHFQRVALYGSHNWQEWAAKVASWFISGDVQSFDNVDEALAWLIDKPQ